MFERIRARFAQPIIAPETFARMRAYVARLVQPLRPYVERSKRAATPAWEAGHAWFDKREPREKVLLRALGAILGILLLYNLIYSPIAWLKESLADRVADRQQELVDLRGLMQTYERAEHSLGQAQRRTVADNPNFSLFSVVEQTLTKSVGRDKIGSITPTDQPVAGGFHQYNVDIKLSGITLPQVVDTLYGVQTLSMPITVSNLQLHQRANDPHSYDVDMSCTALAKSG
jgi:Type II secretion system (T2SS), protein M